MTLPDMITIKGHSVYFNNPSQTIIDLEDLQISTRNTCRYNGNVDWRLIQHLALCTLLAERSGYNPREIILFKGYAATHDLHEIYVGDMVNGLKKYCPEYQRIEANWERYVHQQLGLPYKYCPIEVIKHIDKKALAIEMLMLGHPAANLVIEDFGLVITREDKVDFNSTISTSLSECWNYVNQAINDCRIQLLGEIHGK